MQEIYIQIEKWHTSHTLTYTTVQTTHKKKHQTFDPEFPLQVGSLLDHSLFRTWFQVQTHT